MKKNGTLLIWSAYMKKQSKTISIFCIFLILLFLVYGLYHLPLGPAIYVSLIIGAIAFVSLILEGCFYYKKIKQVQTLQKQAVTYLGELPIPSDLLELEYQKTMQTLEKRCKNTEEKARKSLFDAKRYYTLWSHQVKTPIAGMRLLLQEEMINRSTLEQELLKIEQYIGMALQYQRLNQNINDLLLQQYNLEDLVKQAIKKTALLFIYKKIAIQLSPIDCNIITDEKWFVFVLEQLLTNAVKYTNKGSVSIFLDLNQDATLIIEDTGIGIRSEDLPRIFDWGYTGYNGRLEERSTGVGLSLCSQAFHLLGHSIQITSKVGIGTRVILNLFRESFDIE